MKLKKDDKDQQNDLPDAEVSDVDGSRRGFNKAAGIIAPVLLSLSSRPVWAIDCGTSGPHSGNTSHQCTPVAFTAAYLRVNTNWTAKDNLFDSVFGTVPGSPRLSLFGPNATLMDVLNLASLPTATTNTMLSKAFGDCNNPGNQLRDAVLNFAKQNIASLVTHTAFSNYGYPPSPHIDPKAYFQSQFTGGGGCAARRNLLNAETAKLAALKPSL